MRIKNNVHDEAEISKMKHKVLNIINEAEKESKNILVLNTDSSKENLLNQNAYGN